MFLILAASIIALFLYRQRRKKLTSQQIHHLSEILLKMELWAGKQKIMFDHSVTPLQILKSISYRFPATKDFLSEFIQEYTLVIYQNQKPTKNFKFWKKKWSYLISEILLR